MAAIFCAIVLQTSLGIIQNRTGKLAGLMLDKGSGQLLDYQYTVPGIEHYTRATGTTYDSHSLGLYLAMLAPYAFVFSIYTPSIKWRHRLLSGLFFLLAMAVLVLTFSRSAWLACGISLCVTIAVFFKWKDKYIIPTLIIAFIMAFFLAPWAVGYIYERFASAPENLMTARYDQYGVALRIWRDHFLFGIGAGNYMEALKTYRTSSNMLLPVHNVFLWVAADTGLFGVVVFLGVILSALRRLWKLVKVKHTLFSRVALAALTGLVAYLLDGLTNPLFRESVVYMMFWFTIALSVALPQIEHDERFSEANRHAKLSNE
jgi:O-antigen ligase